MDDELKNGDLDGMDDLEAQLAALGIFGGDDDNSSDTPADPFAGLGFGDDDDPFAALEGLSAPSAPPAPKAAPVITLDDLDGLDGFTTLDDLDSLDGLDFGGQKEPEPVFSGGGDDLDAQLEMLLMADQSADANFEIRDVSVSPTQTVYDPEVDGMGSVQYVKGAYKKEEEKKTKLFADISYGKMAATFIIGFILIVISAITSVLAINAMTGQKARIDALAHFSCNERPPIEIPRGVANNANFIYINERDFIDEQPFTLLRISAAYSGTFIFFEENFNPDDYNILLYNQARNLYARTTFDIIAAPDEGTVLKFAPLSGNTLFLTLHIQCKNSREYVRFNYRFNKPPIHDVPVFINQPVKLAGEDNGILVRHAVFDSASSKIHFSFMPDLQGSGFRLNPDAEGPMIALRDRQTLIHPLTNEDAIVSFDDFGVVIGAATFGSIISLEENIEVIFNDLLYFYPNPTVDVRPSELFRRKENNLPPLPVQTGALTLYLEGMKQQGTLIVMPVHGLDENNRRRPVNMEIYLRVDLADGSNVIMPGIVNVSPTGGSDILFDMRPFGARLMGVDISQYSFIINSVEYTVPAVSVPIHVTRFHNMQSMRRYAAELAVTEAFLGLLAYKSGEITREGIVGLSQSLLDSDELFEIFASAEFNGRAMYTTTVSAGDMLNNYDYVAVIEVLWAADEGANLQYFPEIFEVTAHSNQAIWSVVDVRRR
ncbi:MAG: hypothetical protein FWE27_06265 [Defluviitaleaceae bacterium]|nr:hypothetical protein [Defluviitaleaceae bacterium]